MIPQGRVFDGVTSTTSVFQRNRFLSRFKARLIGFRSERPRRALIAALLASFFGPGADRCAAHPISITYTIAFVSQDQVTVNIEGFLEDLYLFHDLKLDDEDLLAREEIEKGAELHKEFIAEKFIIRDSTGSPLKLQEIRLAAISEVGDGVHFADLMNHEIIYELQYRVSSAPDYLTFEQKFTGESDLLPAEMLLQVTQENADTPHSTSLLPNLPETIRFDWENPPLSRGASDEEWERWIANQRQEMLGITSYASVYSFLYIEDHEVRHEILIPLATLGESVSLEGNDDEFLDLDEQDAARDAIQDYFLEGNPIEIDGVAASGIAERLNFYGADFRDFAQQAPQKRVAISSARVGIILTYPSSSPPETVKLTWDRFSQFVRRVNLAVIAYDETTSTMLGRVGEDHVFEWKNPGRDRPDPPTEVEAILPPNPKLPLPAFSLACLALGGLAFSVLKRHHNAEQGRAIFVGSIIVAALTWQFVKWEVPNPFRGRPEVTAKAADEVFAKLLKNVYGSFRFRNESALYDALATSIHGDLLSDVYVEIQQGLVMQEQGGAISRVGEVEIVNGEQVPLLEVTPNEKGNTGGFGYRSRWNVTGTVEHWGHIHERTNQYSATFAVVPVDGSWKITEFDMQNEERVQFQTRVRSVSNQRDD